MKYICYVLSLAALCASAWNVLHLQNDYATILACGAVVSMQMAIFWKREPMRFRSVSFRRKPIVVPVPKIVMPSEERESV